MAYTNQKRSTNRRKSHIKTPEKLERAKEDAFRLLKYRARSQQEMSLRLKAKGWGKATSRRVINLLKKAGLVDDEALAKTFVQHNLSDSRPHSRWEVKHKLNLWGIPEKVISQALSNWTEDVEINMAVRYLQKRLQDKEKADKTEVARAFRAGVQKGFSFATLTDALRRLAAHDDNFDGEVFA